jgi:hypothetical protein
MLLLYETKRGCNRVEESGASTDTGHFSEELLNVFDAQIL